MTVIVDEGQLPAVLTGLRRAAGLSQREVAMILGVTRARIGQIENRPEKVHVGQLLAFVRAVRGRIDLSPAPAPGAHSTDW